MAEKELDINELCVDELKEELRKLNLQVSGSKAVLRERLKAATCKARSSAMNRDIGKSIDGEESEKDNEEDDEKNCKDNEGVESDSDNEEDNENDETAASRRATTLPLSFKDVEDSL
jgi:hypothetical protein